METDLKKLKKTARTAGLWYFAMLVSGPLGLMIVPSKIISAGNIALTFADLTANITLFKLGILSNFICQITFIFTVLALSRLFSGVSDKYSKMMTSLVIAAVPIAVLTELIQFDVLNIASGNEYLSLFSIEQKKELVYLLLHIHEQGILIASIFWGLWLLPFGILAIKSGFIPRVFGVLLIAGCISYLIDSAAGLFLPDFRAIVTNILMLPLAAGEVSIILWLLIKGVKAPVNIKTAEN